jgi:hypothetical protein
VLGRFVQPDSIVPESQGVQAWDRYAYVNNSPTNYADPSGHKIICGVSRGSCGSSIPPEATAQTITPTEAEPSNQSLTPPIQPIIPPSGLILPNNSYPSTDPSGFYDPALEAWMLFWENVASPSFDMVDAYDFYNLTSKWGWKTVRYSLPTGPIEVSVAGFRQYYRDSWYQSLTPWQRYIRVGVVIVETGVTDNLAGVAGGTGAVIGGAALGPLGAAAGFLGGNALVTEAGDRAWTHFNQRIIQKHFRIGVRP